MLGLALLATGPVRAAEPGDDAPPGSARDHGAPLTNGAAIATGSQAIDLLLRNDAVNKEPAAASAAGRASVAASAASSAVPDLANGTLQVNQASSLRDALLREGAEFAAAHARTMSSADAAELRADAMLDGGPLPPSTSSPAGQVLAGDANGWLSGLHGVLMWLRENRYVVGSWALGFGLLVGLTTMWRAYRRMDQAREQARRRRRDSRPPAGRAEAHGSGRAATRSALR